MVRTQALTKTDTHLRSLTGYDEPEILPSSTRPICLIGADAGQQPRVLGIEPQSPDRFVADG